MACPLTPAPVDVDPRAFQIYDTTLRDGAQREGISYSVADKLAVARLLDELGVGFIEGGWPGALPSDTEFFARAAKELTLETAVLVAFGATRRPGTTAAADPQVQALLAAETPVVCLVAKSDRRHVERALRTTGEENLAMVADTVGHLVAEGRRVFVDCEHFFDGFRHDPAYAAGVVSTALAAGAAVAVLCDTNGGMVPSQVAAAVAALTRLAGVSVGRLGIHCQDDTGCAVANTVTAVEAGVRHVQCTANGYGERTGNADLFAVLGNLALRLGLPVLPPEKLAQMTRISHAIAGIANLPPDRHQPYTGAAAFAHKAGLHASAIKVDPMLYQHVDPAAVGNDMRVLVTEMAGRASVELKSRALGLDLSGRPEVLARVTRRVKEQEAAGWSYEDADASFGLLVREELGEGKAPFRLASYRVVVDHRGDGQVVSSATVTVSVDGRTATATAGGVGPVNALDAALRQALAPSFPELADFSLADYKVRILDGGAGTRAVTRVVVRTADAAGGDWQTVGVHENVVEASCRAVTDALVWGLTARGGPSR